MRTVERRGMTKAWSDGPEPSGIWVGSVAGNRRSRSLALHKPSG